MCMFSSVVLPVFVLNSLLFTWPFPMWSHIYGFWVIRCCSWGKGPTRRLNSVTILSVNQLDLRKGLTLLLLHVSTSTHHPAVNSVILKLIRMLVDYVLSSRKGTFWVCVASQREKSFFFFFALVLAYIIKYANSRVHLKFFLLVLKYFINYGISHIE